MASIETRLSTLESKMNEIEISYTFKIYRAGREIDETPTAWRHHGTGEIYPVNYDFDTMKGYNVLMAEYGD